LWPLWSSSPSVAGRVAANGGVTFTEAKVIYGELHGQNQIVVAGSNYAGTLDKSALKGTGEWVDPKTKDSSTLKFSLKMAE
jgi:hypothetical protein